MATTRLFLRPNPLLSSIFSSSSIHVLFTKPKFTTTFSLFSAVSTTTAPAAAIINHRLPYGPSLLKGKTPEIPKQLQDEANPVFDESQFTRTFDIAALRVPAKDCFALESRLRGHLLNWPRVRNIARVPGDDVDTQFITLLQDNSKNETDEENFDLVNSVLYRDKLVKSFNVRGFVKFRNLAKISRPKRRKKKEKKGEGEEKGNGRKEEFCVVEVVEEESEEMKGLLGEEFRGGEKWKGATRLLLLDEELADKDVEEFPEAIKVSCEFILIVKSIFICFSLCIMC